MTKKHVFSDGSLVLGVVTWVIATIGFVDSYSDMSSSSSEFAGMQILFWWGAAVLTAITGLIWGIVRYSNSKKGKGFPFGLLLNLAFLILVGGILLLSDVL